MTQPSKKLSAKKIMQRQKIMTVTSLTALALSIIALAAAIALRGSPPPDHITAQSLKTRSLSVKDDMGRKRFGIALDERSNAMMMKVYDPEGRERLWLSSNTLLFWDPAGKPRIAMQLLRMEGSENWWEPYIALHDVTGASRIAMETFVGNAGLYLYDQSETPRQHLEVDHTGEGHLLGIYDTTAPQENVTQVQQKHGENDTEDHALLPPREEAQKKVRDNAEREWGSEYDMVQHAINMNMDAYDWLTTQTEDLYIMEKALSEWGYEFHMVKHVYQTQRRAKRELQQSR